MRCRMITRSGEQCKRDAEPGGLGFCWQHVPTDSATTREKWKVGIERVTLLVAATELVLKIGEFAVKHLHEFFGAGDPGQNAARERVRRLVRVPLGPPELPNEYAPGSRVDWIALEEFVREANWLHDHAAEAAPGALEWLEERFDQWYESMNDYHRSILRDQVQALADATGGGARAGASPSGSAEIPSGDA